MTILYDGHIFRWQKTGGISRYFFEIINRLPADWIPLITGVDNVPPLGRPNLSVSTFSSIRPRRISQPIKSWWWRQVLIPRADVVHPTYYDLSGGLRFTDIAQPVVVTAHDFIGAIYPHLEPYSAQTIASQHEAITRADHVICVSKVTERDLLERFPQKRGSTTVIYHGSSFPISPEAQSTDIFERPSFLSVGRRGTYKNFLFVLRAFAAACRSHPTIRLHVAGPPLSDEERWQAHFLGVWDRLDLSEHPSETELHHLYRTSVALLYPSRHEGFGIPPLEAMACGTLAITSNATSLPEVVGDGGIMLDPTDEDAWTDCILAVANQRINREEILERGKRRATELSWESSAQRHAEVYRKLV
jgi:glycosyltransferase involved in cell wall biosynthesis